MPCALKIPADRLPKAPEPTRPAWTKPTVEYPEDAKVIEIIHEPAPEKKPQKKTKTKPKKKPKAEKKISFRAVKDGDRKDWTEEEVETLIRMFNAGAKYREIADEIGHEEGSIATKLKALRKRGLVGSREKLKWTPEEDAVLLNKKDFESYAMIGEKLGKSAGACYSRHMRLEEKKK